MAAHTLSSSKPAKFTGLYFFIASLYRFYTDVPQPKDGNPMNLYTIVRKAAFKKRPVIFIKSINATGGGAGKKVEKFYRGFL
ncbi:MAG TPA: hypothetical protein VEY10_16525 [Flavisolibacter sp.]|jgi:hypothetical protein|nr:hypothetical protein [Flavisolibacter sp.]